MATVTVAGAHGQTGSLMLQSGENLQFARQVAAAITAGVAEGTLSFLGVATIASS